jgi:AcrR family transcriptional regulator
VTGVHGAGASRTIATRETIMETTLRLIVDDGLDKVSWRAIARAVGYSPAGLYEHFANKDAIVAALATEGMAILANGLERIDRSLHVEERVLEMGRCYLRFSREHTGHFHLIFAALPSRRRSRAQPASGAYRHLIDAIQDGIDEGAFRTTPSFDAEAMAYGYWGLVHGLASLQSTVLHGFEAEFEAADEAVLASFVRGLRP